MGSCAAPSAKGDDKFITTDYLQQCPNKLLEIMGMVVPISIWRSYCREHPPHRYTNTELPPIQDIQTLT
ncbi:hypothetical protein FNP80_00735 (plasmid) [Escherichia coli]|nr:hypothetical protein FNP80_00735 [Escherichia coli]